MMEQLTQVDQYAGYIQHYGYPVLAVIISPLASFRAVQWLKLTTKRLTGDKPHWLIMDISGFFIVAAITYWSWSIYAGNAILVALVVSIFHTGIVKMFFKLSPDWLGDILEYGANKPLMAIIVGKDRRKEPRVLTDDETESTTDSK